MNEGDGIFLETWDSGDRKLRWWQFHVGGRPCAWREFYDIAGQHPTRTFMWKGGACRTKARFLAELAKCGLALPDKMEDASEWARFAEQARRWTPLPKK